MTSWADDAEGPPPEPVQPPGEENKEEDVVAALAKAQVSGASEAITTDDGATIRIERAGVEELVAAQSWEDLNLSEALLKGVYLADFPKPFKIQQAALPLILSGFRKVPKENMLAQAKSGSGKTAAFVLGMLANVDLRMKGTQALCVNPTRELANQNANVIRLIGKVLIEEQGLKVDVALPQSFAAADGERGGRRGGRYSRGRGHHADERTDAHIVVGTPGKTLRMVKNRSIQAQGITMLVLDEADEMDSLGHRDDTRSLRKELPDDCQVLCFSATYTDEVVSDIERTVFKRHPHNKVLVDTAQVSANEDRSQLMVRQIAHVWCAAGDHPDGKLGIVEDVYDLLSAQQSIIFVNTRRDVHRIQAILQAKNFSTQDLTGGRAGAPGGMDARERDAAMRRFRDGEVKVLIATNVVSRGVDVPGVNIVINYDLPIDFDTGSADCDTYIHRVGRTGRAGKRGVAINLVDATNPRELTVLRQIEQFCFPGEGAIHKVDAADVETIKTVAKAHLANNS